MSNSETSKKHVIGVDLKSDQVVVSAVSETGEIAVETSCAYDFPKSQQQAKGKHEQDPDIWWNAVCFALGHLVSQLHTKGITHEQLCGISVTSLIGNLVTLNRSGHILIPAIMHDDQRAADQAIRLSMIGNEFCKKIGRPFKTEDVIAKIVWAKDELPDIYENAIFVHQSDYILGRLKGSVDVTDASASKLTGYDSIDNCWPDWLDYDMHLSVRERLPKVGSLGQIVGEVTASAAKQTGLPAKLPVVLGGTSDIAGLLASGARQSGDFFTQFDETLTISGVSSALIHYPHGIVATNRLPNNLWFFSANTNTGTEWIDVWFSQQLANEYIKTIDTLLPSRYIAYPNVRKGELFPFCSNSADGFISPATDNRPVQFASCLQGTAMTERLAYHYIDKVCDNQNAGQVFTIGKWCDSDVWMQCRADVTERVIHRLSHSHNSSFGAAMIAAMGALYNQSIQETSEAMVKVDQSFYPNPEKMFTYKEYFALFQNTMQEQGYLD